MLNQLLASCSLTTPLASWLHCLEQGGHFPLDNRLERIIQLAKHLGIYKSGVQVITVAGTNGKGSTIAILEACLLAEGYQVAAYSSPHLQHYTERLRVQGKSITEEAFVRAFVEVKQVLDDEVLSYFEFTTLASLWLMQQAKLDVWLLEVGLGGRLDAVNCIDADLAIIVSIDFDHQAILGETLAEIAYEKAGIMRAHKPVVIGCDLPPAPLLEQAKDLACPLYRPGEQYERGFTWEVNGQTWCFKGTKIAWADLPMPALPLNSAVVALQTLQVLSDVLPVSITSIRKALSEVSLAGRLQCLWMRPRISKGFVDKGYIQNIYTRVCQLATRRKVAKRRECTGAYMTDSESALQQSCRLTDDGYIWVDVAHNPSAANYLAKQLAAFLGGIKMIAVVGMMADKAITETLQPLIPLITRWHCVNLPSPRAASAALLAEHLQGLSAQDIHVDDNICSVLSKYLSTPANLPIIVFGSFMAVAATMDVIDARSQVRGI